VRSADIADNGERSPYVTSASGRLSQTVSPPIGSLDGGVTDGERGKENPTEADRRCSSLSQLFRGSFHSRR